MTTNHHDHPHNHEHNHDRAQAWLKTAILLSLGLYFALLIATSSLNNY
ncbi:MAG: hypothetical protein JNL34_15370, partial [Anaerolineae bacterium]|nr:hypothetical protein [Anaerolineae bacterium]